MSSSKGGKTDWRATLAAEQQRIYDAVRAWRSSYSKAIGKPAFVILSNRAVAEIARRAPSQLRELRAISGIGEARVKAHGDQVLAVVAEAVRSAPRPDGAGLHESSPHETSSQSPPDASPPGESPSDGTRADGTRADESPPDA